MTKDAAMRDLESGNKALNRDDWISAAIRIFIAEGVEAVRVLRLANHLNVSRGSFYWHFKDRADLLNCISDYWVATNINTISLAMNSGNTLHQSLLAALEKWILELDFSPRLDMAMRHWAQIDPDIDKKVREADLKIIQGFKKLFERSGYASEEAFIRGRNLYMMQVGYYVLDLNEAIEVRLAYLETYFLTYTGRKLDKQLAKNFTENILKHKSSAQS